MIKKSIPGAYQAPNCEPGGILIEDLLCQSPSGMTETFGETEDFTW